eukprot:m.13648 g.13648  ORF g.13648 m.13648 type:complete len:60 (-) comp9798_c0_seq1:175-354(-)
MLSPNAAPKLNGGSVFGGEGGGAAFTMHCNNPMIANMPIVFGRDICMLQLILVKQNSGK